MICVFKGSNPGATFWARSMTMQYTVKPARVCKFCIWYLHDCYACGMIIHGVSSMLQLSTVHTHCTETSELWSLNKALCHSFRGPLGGRLLQRRGSLILRKLSLLLGPQRVFCALADILNQERDLRFASAMVQALNVILLTAPEVRHPSFCYSCCHHTTGHVHAVVC